MRTALYARVSCRHLQGDNFSIETQLETMREYAASHDWKVVAEYVERESAFEDGLNRSELNSLREFVRSNTVDGLVFFSADRFTRDVGDGVVLRRELYKLGIRLFCYYPFPQEIRSENELLNILTDWQNQQYVEKLREASMRGYRKKVEGGAYGQGTAPYGYRIVGSGRDARLEPVPEYAAIVLEIFTEYLLGVKTTVMVARELTERGVPTPGNLLGRPTKRAYGVWTQSHIYKILREETYAGIWYARRFKKVGKKQFVERPRDEWVTIAVPPIVERSLWEAAQERLTARDHSRNVTHQYLMGRRLRCVCGASVRGSFKNRTPKTKAPYVYRYYTCNSKEQAAGACGLPLFNAATVEAAVWDWVVQLLTHPTALLEGYAAAQEERAHELAQSRERLCHLEAEVTEYEVKLTRLLDLYLDGGFPREVLDVRRQEYQNILDRLTVQRDKARDEVNSNTFSPGHINNIVRFVEEVRGRLNGMEELSYELKRQVVETLDLRGKLAVEEGVRVLYLIWHIRHFRIPLQDAEESGGSSGGSGSVNSAAGIRLAPPQWRPTSRRATA